MNRTASLALTLLLCSRAALADDIATLKDGRTVRGTIVREEAEWVGIETSAGTVWLRRTELQSLSKGTPAPEPKPDTPPDERRADPPRDSGSSAEKPPAGTDTAETPPAVSESEEARFVKALGDKDRSLRVEAAQWITDTWPLYRRAVETALRTGNVTARVEAVRLLETEAFGDTSGLLEQPLSDTDPSVRRAALRAARHRRYRQLEAKVVGLFRADGDDGVRKEALRTLEDIGGKACLSHVLAGWSRSTDKDERRRHARVLRAILGEDHGEDAERWVRAVDDVMSGRRELPRRR